MAIETKVAPGVGRTLYTAMMLRFRDMGTIEKIQVMDAFEESRAWDDLPIWERVMFNEIADRVVHGKSET